jgi:hypothetical protein
LKTKHHRSRSNWNKTFIEANDGIKAWGEHGRKES